MKISIFSIIILSSSLLVSCGGGGGGGGNSPQKEARPLEVEMAGIYQALFAPINKTVSGHLNGSLTLVREADEFVADVRFSGGPKSSLHAQSIHIGNRCPDMSDDLNLDGYIDGEEGTRVYDKIIIPLDDDLSAQWLGLGTYPVTDEYGYYFWSRATSFEKIMTDLKENDINLTDEYVKLEPTKAMNLLGRVVVIKGVPVTTVLPETVKGFGRETPHMGLPVACGIIRKLTSTPGVIDTDETGIPVPEGESIGGSSGADDGVDFPTVATTGGTTGEVTGDSGNYGEEDEPETTDNSTEHEGGTTGELP